MEGGALTRIAFSSKASWGYSAAFMQACRRELRVNRGHIAAAARICLVAARRGRPVAFSCATPACGGHWELDAMFVAPGATGLGIGRRLFEATLERARRRGARTLLIQSDPQAEGFYLRMGCRRIGERASDSIAGRRLPLLRCSLAPAAAGPGVRPGHC